MVASLPAGADAVIALGGGTLLQPENLRAVQDRGLLVWLECSLEESLARCESGPQRPLLRLEEARTLLQQRLPGYQAAQLTVRSTRTPDHPAAEIAAWIAALGQLS